MKIRRGNTAIFKKDGHKVVASEPLKCAVDDNDASMAMKLESYPNRDSTVFLDRFGMTDCHTFIRGTYRFQGFSSVSIRHFDKLFRELEACAKIPGDL